MTTKEFLERVLRSKLSKKYLDKMSENAADRMAQIASASFTLPLYQALLVDEYDMDCIAEHLENLHDNDEPTAIVYFISMLAESVDYECPSLFYEMCGDSHVIPYLASAIIDDWFEFYVEDFDPSDCE